MRIVITTTHVPFVRGGAEILTEGLRQALLREAHEVDVITVPFKWYPAEKVLDHMLACRLLDLTEACGARIDKLIALKFPSYLIEHPNKTFWLVHQHRSAYELWDGAHADLLHQGFGRQVQSAIQKADREVMSRHQPVFTISANVSERLSKYCSVASTPLYHPPVGADDFHCHQAGDYFLFPSRLSAIKRQQLVIEALAETKKPVRVTFVGQADHAPYATELDRLAVKLQVADRITWLGGVERSELIRLYASSLGVIFPPFDEDYGYVTLEAMLSSKPVITCTDSGGPLEFIQNRKHGLITEGDAGSLAKAMDELWTDRDLAQTLGLAGRSHYDEMGISWNNVISKLLA